MRKDLKEAQKTRATTEPGDEDPNALYRYASPPCFMHEFATWEAEPMSLVELRGLLNELLAGERAGARGVGEMCREPVGPDLHIVLHDVSKDEARFCAMLTRHIERLGGTPNRATGGFYEKLRNPGNAWGTLVSAQPRSELGRTQASPGAAQDRRRCSCVESCKRCWKSISPISNAARPLFLRRHDQPPLDTAFRGALVTRVYVPRLFRGLTTAVATLATAASFSLAARRQCPRQENTSR